MKKTVFLRIFITLLALGLIFSSLSDSFFEHPENEKKSKKAIFKGILFHKKLC